MHISTLLATGLLALAGATGAQAVVAPPVTLLPLQAGWNTFDVDNLTAASAGLEWIDIADGSALSFQFTVGAGQIGALTVVDAGFAGDRFDILVNGSALGTTTSAVNTYPVSFTLDFDAALADPRFSRGQWGFSAGTYTITGQLATSALDDLGAPLNATVGALMLTLAPVPEASTLAMLLAGLGLVGAAARRRAA